jgi:hypothetical protein
MPERAGNPEDAQLVRDARDELDWSQRQVGKLLGMHQPGVSEVEHQRRALRPIQRATLQRELLRCRAIRCAEQGRVRWETCPGLPANTTHEARVDHVLRCPECIAAASFRTVFPDP